MTTYNTLDDLPERYRDQARTKLTGATVTPDTPAPKRTPSKRTQRTRRAVPTEHQEQVELFSRIDKYIDRYPEFACIAAVPNGLRTSMVTAKKAKAEGLRAGYPDIVVDVPKRHVDPEIESLGIGVTAYRQYHGLRIELKRTKGGHVDPEQKVWHERLHAAGYRVEICRGCDEAWKVICEYLGVNP